MIMQTILVLAAVPLVCCIVFGFASGALLRQYHERGLQVSIGAATFMALIYALVIWPMLALKTPSGEPNLLAALPGAGLLILLQSTDAIYRTPIIGAALRSFALATARRQIANAQKQLEKLEAIDSRGLQKANA